MIHSRVAAFAVAAAMLVAASPAAAGGVFWTDEDQCKQSCDVYTMDDWTTGGQAGTNPVAAPSDTTAGGKSLGGVGARASFSPPYPGVYTFEYNSRDTCNVLSATPATMTVDVWCNNKPVVALASIDTLTATVQYGAEVLLDARRSYDPDRDNLDWTWCLERTAPGAEGLTVAELIAAPDTAHGYAFLRPQESGTYKVTASVTDGCNRFVKTFDVTVDVQCCNSQATAVAAVGAADGATVRWSDVSNSYTIPLDGSNSIENSCLPPDYGVNSAIGGKYKFRYSPAVPASSAAGPARTRELGGQPGLTPVLDGLLYGDIYTNSDPVGSYGTEGCTWPGATNDFNRNAQVDDGSCTCPDLSYKWYILDGDRAMDAAKPTIENDGARARFYTEHEVDTVVDQGGCRRTVDSAVTLTPADITAATFLKLRGRVQNIDGPGILANVSTGPVTSWDAEFRYQVSSKQSTTFLANYMDTKTTGQEKWSCALEFPAGRDAATASATIATVGSASKEDCLGSYQFKLDTWITGFNTNTCPIDSDTFTISVTCNDPPYVEVLCDQSTLSNGDSFPTNYIDARTSFDPPPDQDLVTYIFDVMQIGSWSDSAPTNTRTAPMALQFPGAGKAGPAAGAVDLTPVAMATNLTTRPVVTGDLHLYLGGWYEVKLTANDGCNAPVSDTTTIQAECLRAIPMPEASYGDATNGNTQTTKRLGQGTINIANGGSSTPEVDLQMVAQYYGNNNTVNYGYRITGQSQLNGGTKVYGYVYAGGADAPAGSYECTIGDSWGFDADGASSGPGMSDNAHLGSSKTATFKIKGTYTVQPYLIDTCHVAPSAQTFSVAMTCDASSALGALTVAPAAPVSLKYSGGRFRETATAGNDGFALPEATSLNALHFNWYITDAPAESLYTLNNMLYPATDVPGPVTCDADAWTIGTIAPQDGCATTNPRTGSRPLCSSAARTSIETGASPVARIGVDVPGDYKIVVQSDNECEYKNLEMTATAECNEPATFIIDNTADMYTAVLPQNSQFNGAWDCYQQRFSTVFLRAVGSQGSDDGNDATGFSNRDSLNYQFMYKSAPPGSWYHADRVTHSVTWTTQVSQDASVDPYDMTRYDTMATAIKGAINLALAGAKAAGDTKDYTAHFTAETRVPAESVTVTYEVPACWDYGWGHVVTFTATFTVMAPSQFSAPTAGSLATSDDVDGYGDASKDMRPRSEWEAAFNAFAPNGGAECGFCAAVGYPLFTGLADSAPVATAGTVTSSSTAVPIPANTPYGAVQTKDDNDAQDRVPAAQYFIPDTAPRGNNQYQFDVKIWDDCPGTTPATTTLTATIDSIQCDDTSDLPVAVTGKRGDVDGMTFTSTWQGKTNGLFGDPVEVTGNITRPDETEVAVTSSSIGPLAKGAIPTLLTTAENRFTPQFGAWLKFNFNGGGTEGQEVEVCWVTGVWSGGAATDSASWTSDCFFVVPLRNGASWTVNLPQRLANQEGTFGVRFNSHQSTPPNLRIDGAKIKVAAGRGPTGACRKMYSFVATGNGLDTTSMTPANKVTGAFTDYDANPVEADVWKVTVTPTKSTQSQGYRVGMTVSQVLPYWSDEVSSCVAQTQNNVRYTTSCLDLGLSVEGGLTKNVNFDGFSYEHADFLANFNRDLYKVGDINFKADVTFTFQVINAPAGSVLNPDYLVSNVIKQLPGTSTDYTGPDAPTVTFTAGDDKDATVAQDDGSSLARHTEGNWTLTTYKYVDPANVEVFLLPKRDSSIEPAVPDDEGRDQKDRFLSDLQRASCFQPDLAGDYVIRVTADDGCQTDTKDLTVHARPCNSPTAVAVTASAVDNTQEVMQRVTLTGTVTPTLVKSFWWTLEWVGADPPATMPTLLNAKSMNPSFIPVRAGQYQATLHVDNGCGVVSSTNPPITVSCKQISPVYATTVSAVNHDLWHDSSLTLLNPAGPVEMFGSASCQAKDSYITFKEHTCDIDNTQFSVNVASVTPAHIPFHGKSWIEIVVTINFQQMLPPSITPNVAGNSDNPYTVTLVPKTNPNGQPVACTDVMVVNADTGTITCKTVAHGSEDDYFVQVEVLGVKSFDLHSVAATISYKKPTPMTATAAPATGGTVTITGPNVGFGDGSKQGDWMASWTQVKIDGKDCTNVASPAVDTLTCTIGAGYGKGKNVWVNVAYGPTDNVIPNANWVPITQLIWETSDTNDIYAYQLPKITDISPATGSVAGGYVVTVTVDNLGPTDDGTWDSNFAYMSGSVAGTMKGKVTSTTGNSATVDLVMPPAGCGANAVPFRVARADQWSLAADATFTYDIPTVTCVGEPVVDQSLGACPRIFFDGVNLFGEGEEVYSDTMVSFQPSDGSEPLPCGDIRVVPGSGYNRFSCRVPPNAGPGDAVTVHTCRGVTNTNAAELPFSITYAQCGGAHFIVGENQDFSADIQPALVPSANATQGGSAGGYTVGPSGQITYVGGGGAVGSADWEKAPLNNQTFAGIMITILVLFVLAYPILMAINHCMSTGKCCGGGSKRTGGPMSLQIPDWQRNPAGRAKPAAAAGGAAAAAPAKPAAAPSRGQAVGL